jgi:SAM-dependent methyltransferase
MSDLSLDQQPEGWTHAAQAYDTMAAPFTALFAQDALRLANVQPGQRVLDVAAGTGALSFAAVERGAEDLATDFAPGMVEHLRAKVATQGVHGMQVAIMDGQALEVEDNSFDAAFSILGLIYFPDRAAGFRELSRALRPGGRAVVVGWSTIERLRFIQAILGALREAVPDVPPPPSPHRGSHWRIARCLNRRCTRGVSPRSPCLLWPISGCFPVQKPSLMPCPMSPRGSGLF